MSPSGPPRRRAWVLTAPGRFVLKHWPWRRGRAFLSRWLIGSVIRLLPSSESFILELPLGATVQLRTRESLGRLALASGDFERAELEWAAAQIRPRGAAIDVGANVGLFSLVLARASGGSGEIHSFEPFPESLERLRDNLARNGADNVTVHPFALSDDTGTVQLGAGHDPAFLSIVGDPGADNAIASLPVETRMLDDVWDPGTMPPASFIKIDVEGAELKVLNGARELIARDTPALLIEANSDAEADLLRAWIAEFPYREVTAPGVEGRNLTFLPNRNAAAGTS